MICILVSKCSYCSNSNWFNFVASTGLTVTGLLLVLYLTHIVEKLKFFPWLAVELLYSATWTLFYIIAVDVVIKEFCEFLQELLYSATWTLFYMIAALVVAVKGGRDDAWAAAGFFGFVGAILYAADCYTKYKSWRDGVPAQGEKPVSPNYAAY
ncbi:hypothetical protein AVEN_73150-1 [Araneus ventricosus]|uniref:MARVEL domain-containing protein n=1 Tax=Araneus ventricosus TaxID=182803 RepID=A0A4Y2J0A7_ARAVE|nr:hypothetical protein AVEN_73150-1 [Araneus ventricosus]